MSIPISSNFNLAAQLPLDARTVVADITARDLIPSIQRYEGMIVYVTDIATNYQLKNGITNGNWVNFGGDRFGIEDNTSDVDRSIDMGDHSMIISNASLVDINAVNVGGDQCYATVSNGTSSLYVYASGGSINNTIVSTNNVFTSSTDADGNFSAITVSPSNIILSRALDLFPTLHLNTPLPSAILNGTKYVPLSVQVNGTETFADTTGKIDLGTLGSSTAWGSITGALSSQTDLQTALNAKQATLVSSTNIKTVNGNTLLGSGDLSIISSSPYSVQNTSSIFSSALTSYTGNSSVHSFFSGLGAGLNATSASYSIFNGWLAGQNATTAQSSIFLGAFSGYNATNARDSVFLGQNSGGGAVDATHSNFIGPYAGYSGIGGSLSTNSNFIGHQAGQETKTANNSNFFGRRAGSYITSGGAYCNLIGTCVGSNSEGNTMGSNNTVIGTGITTINQTISNTFNFGNVLYGVETYSGYSFDAAGFPLVPSIGTPQTTGRVGINVGIPNASSALEVQSTTMGVLFPRMTTTQKNAIVSPAEGLVVYDLTLHKLCVKTVSAWETITSI